MRILIGCDTYHPDVNGASYFAQRLAAGMAGRDHEVHVLCPSRSHQPTRKQHAGVTLHGLPSLPLPFQKGFRFCVPAGLERHVGREVEDVNPDVVHVQSHFCVGRALIRTTKKQGIPTVATNHFMPDNLVFYLRLPGFAERAIKELAWRDFVRVFDQVETVTSPTPFAARLIEEKGIKRDVIPVSCGIDPDVFNPGNSGEEFREKYGVDRRPGYLYVGRLDEEKRVGDLIRALPLVRKRADAQLILVGHGHQREGLERLARRTNVEDHVTFTGFVPDEDLPGAYAACDVFCNSGTAELQGIVVMEAMATGKPVVCADANALPLLARDSQNGYTFEPGDVATLADRVAELLNSPEKRAEMGRRSLEIIAAHNSQESLRSYESLYKMVRGTTREPDANNLERELAPS